MNANLKKKSFDIQFALAMCLANLKTNKVISCLKEFTVQARYQENIT